MAISTSGQLRRGGARALFLVMATTAACPATLFSQSSDTTKTFFTRRDAELSGVALVGTAILTRFDARIANWAHSTSVQGSPSRQRIFADLTHVNETTLTAASILSYGVGRLVHSSTIADVSLHTAEATPTFTRGGNPIPARMP